MLTRADSGLYIESRRRRGRLEEPPLSSRSRVTMDAARVHGLVATFVLLAAAGVLAAADDKAVKPASRTPASSSYVIGVGDVLRITVWKEPDLTLDATVRLDGRITLPLLGDVEAAGRAPGQLAAALMAELEKYMEKPRVTVAVSQANSARVYVVGQTMRPGEFPLTGRMTVLKALALAGGFKEFARPESIVIVREDQTVLAFNYKRVAEGKDLSQNILLAPWDTIVVP
jgi:polysaccharide biosynthesis/export protein